MSSCVCVLDVRLQQLEFFGRLIQNLKEKKHIQFNEELGRNKARIRIMETHLDFGVEFLIVGVDGIFFLVLVTSFKQVVSNFDLH